MRGLAIVLSFLLLIAGPGAGQEPGANEFAYSIPPEGITLEQLIADARDATGRTFLLTDQAQLRGKVIRFFGEARVPDSQRLALFQGLLVTQGFALKPFGEGPNAVLSVESIETPGDLRQRAQFVAAADLDARRHDVGTILMTVFTLDHAQVGHVRNGLSQILTSRNVELMLDVPSGRALLVIGFAPTLYAMKQIVAFMDVPRAEAEMTLAVVALKHAVAEEVEPILQDLVESSGALPPAPRGDPQAAGLLDSKPAARVLADPRMNAIVVYAVQSDIDAIKALVAQLDEEFAEPPRNLRIYRLKHVNAEDLAEILVEAHGFSRSGGTRASGAPARGATRADDDVMIVPEPLNNALIIRANRVQYETLKPVIEALDRERAQVMVRGVVAELTDEQFRSITTEIAAFEGGDGYRLGALTGFGASVDTVTAGPPPTFTRLPVFPGTGQRGGVFGLFTDELNVPILLSLLQSKSRGNLLSAPVVIALDNDGSTIESSRQIPKVEFQTTQTGDSSNFSGYEEAKISMTVSPRVSNDNYVRLDLDLLVEAFVPGTGGIPESQPSPDSRPAPESQPSPDSRPSAPIPPDKTSRRLIGSVTVRDGATVVIGGLRLSRDRTNRDGVPPFADTPLLGPMFRSDFDTRESSTIFFFVQPTIIQPPHLMERIAYQKKLEMLKLNGPISTIDPNFLDMPRYEAIVAPSELR